MAFGESYLVIGGLVPQEPPPPVMASPEIIAEIRRLKEQADWMGRLLEDDSTTFSYGNDGTLQFGVGQGQPNDAQFTYAWAYSRCLYRPSYGAAFYLNDMEHRIIVARSRAFCSTNPYWHGVQHNLKTHAVGLGSNWTVVPRSKLVKVSDTKIAKAQKELDEFYESGYRQVQMEKLDRKSRDGEYFLHILEEDGRVRVRFVEPLCVWTPPVANTEGREIIFGIQFKKGDYERALRYHARTTDFLGGTLGEDPAWVRGIAAENLQHRKVNVDRGTPRGIPDTYWVQARLEQCLRTLKAMGTLVQVRAKIAMIRKRVNALAGSVTPMLSAAAATTVTNGFGQVRNVFAYPDGAILDTSDQAEHQFPSQNIETDKIVHSVQADLQAVATSMGLAEYMVSGSLGSSSYASAMVAEGPVVKTFEMHQQDMQEEDQEIAARVLETGVKHGRLADDTLELVKVQMNGPSLAGRNATQEAQAYHIYLMDGVISIPTVRQRLGLDAETEEENIKKTPGPLGESQKGGDGQANGNGQLDGQQAGNLQKANARPFSPNEEPRQMQRASGATREEEQQVA